MKFKNKLFEQNLCEAFGCNKRHLLEHLPNVEQVEINGSFQNPPLTLFVRDKNSLIRPVEVHVDFDSAHLADLGMFNNLRGMKAACRRNLRKLFVHSWPVGVSSIVWQDIGDASEELIANLDRFEALSQLTLYGTIDTVWPEFSAEVKSRLKQFSVKHFDCKHLEGFNNLVKLNLAIVENLKDMPQLETVKDFEGSSLHGIDGIQAMPNLERLDVNYCNVSSLAPLSAMDKLREADLSRNYIHDLKPISGLREIDALMLSDNLIEDISPLSGLPLSYLDLSHNPLEDITALKDCGKLECLDLRDTYVRDISVLSGLENLRELHICIETLKDRKQLAALSHVESINGIEFGECLWLYKVNCQ